MPTYQQDTNMGTDQYMNWADPSVGADLPSFNDPPLYDFGNGMGGHQRVVSLDTADDVEMNQGQLIRRNPNQQLAPRRGQWDGYPSPTQQQWENVDDEDALEQKVAIAKKDAQAKRKQIPPFVQKLSSFLDNNKNENLIRWSDDGNSFIVIDEDEFARTLIPELFKHNNYASFVRQLNMYGFHKKVGLSDNSMKASETKAKAPSEYFNKYFKRGRSELLWLIQKPKNPTIGPKRKREENGKGDSDEDRKYGQDTGGGGYVEELAVRGNNDMAMIPRSEYNSLRVEVRQLQDQQKLISNVLTQMKRQNEELYSRATSFQALHDRHENSINAILTFLATFYNRSLEGNANGMNLADMFPAARQQTHGNVVDVDDFPAADLSMNKSPQLQRSKRPLALLPAPPTADGRSSATSPTSNRPIPSPITRPGSRQQNAYKPSAPPQRQSSTVNASLARDAAASSLSNLKIDSPTTQPSPSTEAIMSAIRNVNANAGSSSQAPQFDFSGALSNLQTQDGNVPLTPQERNETISRLMSDATSQALANPNPAADMLNQHQQTQQQFELLQNLSHQQSRSVQSLQERFASLSPSGQIQGLDNGYFDTAGGLGEPGQLDLDLDAFVHQDQDYFPHNSNNMNGANNDPSGLPDFNFDTATPGDANGFGTTSGGYDFGSTDGLGDGHLHVDGAGDTGRVESVSSNATSPAASATVEEVEDEERVRSPKRRKK